MQLIGLNASECNGIIRGDELLLLTNADPQQSEVFIKIIAKKTLPQSHFFLMGSPF
jgi:hypothetical protein